MHSICVYYKPGDLMCSHEDYFQINCHQCQINCFYVTARATIIAHIVARSNLVQYHISFYSYSL